MNNYKNGVHDPTIVKADGTYYLFSTDTNQPLTSGVPIRSSKDLINWQFEKNALEGVPEDAKKWSKSEGLWAPEIIKVAEEYRMYYSSSTFGSTTSFIGLAVSKSPLGPWEDRGEVVKTSPELTDHNAIDANICKDRDGNQWLIYGSFFGGIYIAPMNKKTGKLSQPGFGKMIAKRPKSVDRAIEGPFIIYHAETDYFYLFVSYDSLNDFYNIRVARSKRIEGPYQDFNDNALLDQDLDPDNIGTKILGGYQFSNEPILYAPGHNSILRDEDKKQDFIVHHARSKPHSDCFFLQIRPLFWLENGWPVVAPYEYKGPIKVLNNIKEELYEKWEIVMFNGSDVKLSQLVLDLSKFLNQVGEQYLFYKEVDNEQLYITGMTKAGITYFGKLK